MQGAQVRSLVGEQRFCLPHRAAKIFKKLNFTVAVWESGSAFYTQPQTLLARIALNGRSGLNKRWPQGGFSDELFDLGPEDCWVPCCFPRCSISLVTWAQQDLKCAWNSPKVYGYCDWLPSPLAWGTLEASMWSKRQQRVITTWPGVCRGRSKANLGDTPRFRKPKWSAKTSNCLGMT